MKCRYSENDIALYVGGDLLPSKAFEIQRHLMACDECRELSGELRDSQGILKSLRQDPVSTTALAAVRMRVLAEIGRRSRWVGGRWVYAVAGAVFVAVVSVGVSVYMRYVVKNEPTIIPLLSKGGVAAPSNKWSLPLNGADGVVGSTSDNRLLEPTTFEAARCRACAPRPSAPAKVASRHSVDGRSHPSFSKEGNKNSSTNSETVTEPAKPLVVKLFTDDPNIVIYWLVDQTGGTL